jgi:hypothetical protein
MTDLINTTPSSVAGDGDVAVRVRQTGAARPAVRPGSGRVDVLVPVVARVGVLAGASAAVYAVCLAGISSLQAMEDASLRAARAPAVASIEVAAQANDRLEAAVLRAGTAATSLGDSYASTARAVAEFEVRLDQLAALVADVEGRAAALPSRIALPPLAIRGTSAPAPRTRATTGASGG